MNTKKIVFPNGKFNKVCGVCNGSGRERCPRCAGTGTFEDKSKCYYCQGSGTITCNVCNGRGYYD